MCWGTFAQDLNAVWQGILANPPALKHTEARHKALEALDERLAQADSERAHDVIAYYQRAVNQTLDLLESEHPAAGLRLFQLYSSSVIVQNPETVFAIDLVSGLEEAASDLDREEGSKLRMTSNQIARFARLIDISFHTHEHLDHIDAEITKALCEAGKTVVVTESNRKYWQDEPWANDLVVLQQTVAEPHSLGALSVDVLHDFQWDTEDHSSGTPCNAYLITTPGGMSVLTKGDINCGLRLYGWLEIMAANGRHVDLVTGSSIFWRGVNTAREIDALFSPVWAIGHVWEFTHRSAGKPGGATGTYTTNLMLTRHNFLKGTPIVLSWGEYLDLGPRTEPGQAPDRTRHIRSKNGRQTVRN
jgi:L-ascorbate metabolism protein UlaG (beta-lactamase superfamily)